MVDAQPTHSDGDCSDARREEPHSGTALDQSDLAILRMRYQELFDFALSAQTVTDVRGLILEANHAAAALFGLSKAFLLGKPMGLLLSEGYRSDYYKCLPGLRRGGSAQLESRVGRNGASRTVALRAVLEPRTQSDQSRLWWQIEYVSLSRESEGSRHALMRRLMATQEIERRRLSREVHDQLGQDLTALTLGLKGLEGDIPETSAARGRLRDLQAIADRMGVQAHDIAFELRPAVLDDLGLAAATESLVRRWSLRSGIAVGFHCACPGIGRFPPDVESALYRITQEALTNVSKHAQASSVSVIVEHADGCLMGLIEDDGRGFDSDAQEHSGSLGFLGMSERLALVGGTLQIESSPGAGTTIRARIPCEVLSEAAAP